MGFLDNVKSTAQRGKDSVGRKSRETQLKMQLNDLAKQRKELAAQLGASLYDEVKDKVEFTAGREGLFEAIANVDAQRQACENEIAEIEAEAAAAAAAAAAQRIGYNCPQCGFSLKETDMFCSGCGAPVAEYIAAQKAQQMQPAEPVAAAQGFCTNCGSPLHQGDRFCMQCGTPVEAAMEPAPAEPVEAAPVEAAPAASDAAEPIEVASGEPVAAEGDFIVEKVGTEE